MNFLQLSFINLTKFIREHTAMFIIFILVEIVSITAILSSYGLMANSMRDNNTFTQPLDYVSLNLIEYDKEYDNLGNFISQELKYDIRINIKEFKSTILKFIDNNQYLKDNVEYIYLVCNDLDDKWLRSRYYPEYSFKAISDDDFYLQNGFRKNNYLNGDKIISRYLALDKEQVETMIFNNTEYKVQYREFTVQAGNQVVYTSLEDNVLLEYISICTINPLQYYELEELQESLCDFMNIKKEYSYIPPEPEPIVIQINNTIILCCILIILVILINVSLLYKYIIVMRTRNLSISKLCGCTSAKGYIIYMTEIMTIIVICYVLSVVLFNFAVAPLLAKSFTLFETAYPVQLHIIIFLAYIITAFLLMTSHICKILKQPMVFLKKGGK